MQYPYWEDTQKGEFSVSVLSCKSRDGKFVVQINKNVVRPEGGCQAGEKGWIVVDDKRVPFYDTLMDDGVIALLIDSEISSGKKVKLIIDKEWRNASRRNHTAEHLFVASMIRQNPSRSLGYIWIDGERGTVDVHGEAITTDDLFNAERAVQDIINQELPIKTKIVKGEELDESVRAREGVQSKEGPIRIVSVGNYDSSACSGLHVENSSEIQFFKITDYKILPDKTRIEFMTGPKAIDQVVNLYNKVLSRKIEYPYEMNQIGPVLDKAKKNIEEKEAMVETISSLLENGPRVEELNDVKFMYQILPGFDAGIIRNMILSMKLEGPLAIFYMGVSEKCNFVFWTNEMEQDASDYIKDIILEMGGKGGGSKEVFTGGFPTTDEYREKFHQIVAKLKENIGCL